MADERKGPDDDLIPLGPWTGLNQIDDERSLLPTELLVAENIDFKKGAVAVSREGQTERLTLTDAHSLWSNGDVTLLVSDGDLGVVDINEWTFTALVEDIHRYKRVSYTQATGYIFWSNRDQHGRLNGLTPSPWSVPTPGTCVAEPATIGGMTEGSYLVALVFVSSSGEEGGATIAAKVDVEEGGGIQLSRLPQHDDVSSIRVYQTKPNEEVLYHRVTISMGQRAYHLGRRKLGMSLRSQFAEAVPPGDIIRYHNGHIFFSVGRIVAYTLPHLYGRYVPDRDVLPPFNATVTVIEPVGEAGLYIVADRTYYVVLGEGGILTRKEASAYGAVPYSSIQVPADTLGLEGVDGRVPCWVPVGAHAAFAVGLPGGTIRYYGKDKVAIPEYSVGASILQERAGIRKIVAAMQNPGTSDAFGSGDSASIDIIRNGVSV